MKIGSICLATLLLIQPLRAADDDPELAVEPEVTELVQPQTPSKRDTSGWRTAGMVLASIAMVTVGLVLASSNDGHHVYP